ncbi:MAG: S41 family peptidase [Pirellulales bacterium]
MPRSNLNLIWVAGVISLLCYSQVNRSAYGRYFVEALETIHYLGLEEKGEQELFDAAMYAMAKQHDKYSTFVSRELKNPYEQQLDQQFVGIGTKVELDPDGQGILIANPVMGPTHPAYDAGIRTGDIIVAVEGRSIKDLPQKEFRKTVESIKGPAGTYVQLTVKPEGRDEQKIVRVKRSKIRVDSLAGDIRGPDRKWRFLLAADPRIVYLRLTQFGAQTVAEMQATLEELKEKDQLNALILDLRDNPGGYLDASWQVCNLFISSGVIVETRYRDNSIKRRYEALAKNTFSDFPMVVLVNGESASASEIVAACFQDHGRAVVCGVRTYGKGSVQDMIPMEGQRSILKLTTASFWRPSDKNIHRKQGAADEDEWGVKPDDGFGINIEKKAEKQRRKLRDEREAFRENRNDVVEGCLPAIDLQLKKAVEYLRAKLVDAQ